MPPARRSPLPKTPACCFLIVRDRGPQRHPLSPQRSAARMPSLCARGVAAAYCTGVSGRRGKPTRCLITDIIQARASAIDREPKVHHWCSARRPPKKPHVQCMSNERLSPPPLTTGEPRRRQPCSRRPARKPAETRQVVSRSQWGSRRDNLAQSRIVLLHSSITSAYARA